MPLTGRLFRCGTAPTPGILRPVNLQLAYSDAYARSLEARVVAVDRTDGTAAPTVVTLDQTVFYPGGGGQPADRGTLLRAQDGRRWTIESAGKRDGEIVHELAGEDEPPAV